MVSTPHPAASLELSQFVIVEHDAHQLPADEELAERRQKSVPRSWLSADGETLDNIGSPESEAQCSAERNNSVPLSPDVMTDIDYCRHESEADGPNRTADSLPKPSQAADDATMYEDNDDEDDSEAFTAVEKGMSQASSMSNDALINDGNFHEDMTDECTDVDDTAAQASYSELTSPAIDGARANTARKGRVSQALPSANAPIVAQGGNHETKLHEPARRNGSVPPSLDSAQTTPKLSEIHYEISDNTFPGELQSLNNNTAKPNPRAAHKDIEMSDYAESGYASSNNTLQSLRRDFGKASIGYLPGIKRLDWRVDTTDSTYLPLALMIGYFPEDSDSDFYGCYAWAYFKKDARSSVQIFLTQDEDGVDYLDDGAQVSLNKVHNEIKFDHEFEHCRDPTDITAMIRYFFLLAAEAPDKKTYGVFEPLFSYDKPFQDRMRAICKRWRQAAKFTGSTSRPGRMASGSSSGPAEATKDTPMTDTEQDAEQSTRHTSLTDCTSLRPPHVSATPLTIVMSGKNVQHTSLDTVKSRSTSSEARKSSLSSHSQAPPSTILDTSQDLRAAARGRTSIGRKARAPAAAAAQADSEIFYSSEDEIPHEAPAVTYAKANAARTAGILGRAYERTHKDSKPGALLSIQLLDSGSQNVHEYPSTTKAREARYQAAITEREDAWKMKKERLSAAGEGQRELLRTVKEMKKDIEEEIRQLRREEGRAKTWTEKTWCEEEIDFTQMKLTRIEERISVIENSRNVFAQALRDLVKGQAKGMGKERRM